MWPLDTAKDGTTAKADARRRHVPWTGFALKGLMVVMFHPDEKS